MNIKEILESKPHNKHYLNRYIKYIDWCKNNQPMNEYMENHHICPKADDLFPEYKDININKWNNIKLSTRQHLIAHIILWKVYGGSQARAIYFFLNVNGSGGAQGRKIPTAAQIRYVASLRDTFKDWRKEKSTFKDATGKKYFLETKDPLIQELGLVGYMKDTIQTELHKQRHSDAKLPNKVIEIYFLDNKRTVKLYSEDFHNYIEQGWKTYRTSDDYEYIRKLGNAKLAIFWTGRNRYATPDGVYFGSYLRGDPIIEKYDLILYRTEKQIAQNLGRTKLATEARLGTNIYTNGIDEIFANEPPDDTWALGRKPRNEEWETKRKSAAAKKFKGSTTYTNGLVNMPIQEGDTIPDGFYPGMKQRPGTVYSYTNKDKTILLQFTGTHKVPTDLIRIKGIDAVSSIKKKLGL